MSDVSLRPSTNPTTSGQVFFSDAVTTAAQIKGTAGQLYMLDLVNGTAATAYLQIFFRPAAQITLGVTLPDLVIKLATNAVQPMKSVPFPVPVGGLIPVGTTVFGSLGLNKTGPGTGLTIAGTTGAANAATATIGVTAVYF